MPCLFREYSRELGLHLQRWLVGTQRWTVHAMCGGEILAAHESWYYMLWWLRMPIILHLSDVRNDLRRERGLQ